MFFKSKRADVSDKAVLKALASVQDPDLRRDIVSLGFIKNLSIRAGAVKFDVELTTPACPVKEELKAQCEAVVKAIPGVSTVEVTMTSNTRSSNSHAGHDHAGHDHSHQGHSHGAPAAAPKGGGRLELPTVKNVVAVASGKGGVGKSTVTINIAMALAETGAKVGLLDADIYGPSVPMMMGVKDRPQMHGERVIPLERHGIKMMSMGFLIPEDQAVVWRGPMVHGALTQFMSQVEWGDLDYLLIDMPPGTGDAQLTISQTAPLSGAIIVTTPQEVSLLDARRGLMMFQNVKIPILGIIENMAGFVCSHCEEVTQVFRTGGGARIADEFQVPLLGSLPLDPRVAESGDTGRPMVQSHPDSEVAKGYRKIAGEVAAKLAMMSMPGAQAGGFKPMSLQWT